jgi:uncharacterized protein (TIGR00299 family) protein
LCEKTHEQHEERNTLTRITLIDPQTAGVSGDMLLAALIDAGADIKRIQRVLDLIPLHYPKCKKIRLQFTEVKRHGFRAGAVDLEITEEKGETDAQDFLRAAENIAKASQISQEAITLVARSLEKLVCVESRLHGISPDKAHLHEAGSADTLADVIGVATACDLLGVFDGEIYSTPVAVGGGLLSFSHGTVAAPAPAVLEIARERSVPIHGGPENVELATPTGIAILANLAHKFVENYPALVPETIGHGAGKRELNERPNLLRVVIGRGAERTLNVDIVNVLATNLDDLPGEVLGHALQQILDAGAKDAWITPAQFKKNRPGHVLQVICDPADAERLASLMMKETGTLGVRYQLWNRFTLPREITKLTVEIQGRKLDVRVKFARDNSGRIINIKPEFEDIQAIAKELSIPARKVAEIVLREAQEKAEE